MKLISIFLILFSFNLQAQTRTKVSTSATKDDVSDTLKYENAGAMIGGYASFGGATDGSACSASPCTKYREVGDDGVSLSASRIGTGNYGPVTATGFKPNSFVDCKCTRADNGSTERQCDLGLVPIADGAGEVSFRLQTNQINTNGHTIQDTFFTVHCIGPRP